MTATAAIVRRLPYVLPLVIFALLALYFWAGLGRDPHALAVGADRPAGAGVRAGADRRGGHGA